MTVPVDLGVAQRPWLVVEVDLADGLPALPALDGAGQPVGGAFVLVRVFSEPVAGLWVVVPDAGLSAEELGRAADAQAGRELRARLRAAGWRDHPAGLPAERRGAGQPPGLAAGTGRGRGQSGEPHGSPVHAGPA